MAGKPDDIKELLDNIVSEPGETYDSSAQFYINPFDDWAFKRIFASEAHKEVIMAFLNGGFTR